MNNSRKVHIHSQTNTINYLQQHICSWSSWTQQFNNLQQRLTSSTSLSTRLMAHGSDGCIDFG